MCDCVCAFTLPPIECMYNICKWKRVIPCFRLENTFSSLIRFRCFWPVSFLMRSFASLHAIDPPICPGRTSHSMHANRIYIRRPGGANNTALLWMANSQHSIVNRPTDRPTDRQWKYPRTQCDSVTSLRALFFFHSFWCKNHFIHAFFIAEINLNSSSLMRCSPSAVKRSSYPVCNVFRFYLSMSQLGRSRTIPLHPSSLSPSTTPRTPHAGAFILNYLLIRKCAAKSGSEHQHDKYPSRLMHTARDCMWELETFSDAPVRSPLTALTLPDDLWLFAYRLRQQRSASSIPIPGRIKELIFKPKIICICRLTITSSRLFACVHQLPVVTHAPIPVVAVATLRHLKSLRMH